MAYSNKKSDGDDIVISGISGVFPLSRNIKEFEYNLYNKVNMVNDDESRWKHTNPNVPRYTGKVPNLTGFDATFFGVHQMQADNMDPQNRLLIEESFKCVIDAGVNPNELRGQNTGVYIGSCVSESESYLCFSQNVPSGFGIIGCSKAMFANRISYSLGLNGPSMLCDTACSSSMYALSLAYRAFQNGEIDSAIVGGANLCLHPHTSLQFCRLGVLSSDGFSRPFDSDANGYNRSEAVSCIFLQRKSASKRVYATLVHCDTNCDGYKTEGMTFPCGAAYETLLNTVYSEKSFNVQHLGFLEAHCAGTIAGDIEECKAIDNTICKKRKEKLLVGSVKSNCGHTEPASGIASIAKVILTMENNLIPPNINFERPREDVEALKTGRLRVVLEPTTLPKPYVGINSFSFGGANSHALLKQFDKQKTTTGIDCDISTIPRLVTWSGRSEKAVNLFFDDLEKRPLDKEYLALVQGAQAGGIQGMVFRGYSIFASGNGSQGPPSVIKKSVQHYGGVKRPVVWVFSGMGSQWVGMGKALMQLPVFAQSIQRSHNTLKPSGIDLINVITSDDPLMFDYILHSFVGIAAIQIALVDVLRALNVTPDFIIGHSVGELGCAYADNCMTAEQMILAAYYRGKVSAEGDKIKGSMAAVGSSFKDLKPLLPKSIDIACHNSSDSCTISGPCEDIADFVKVLKSKNIFAREVACSNIAYHSRYIAQFGPDLLKYLKHILPKPMLRSNKWISTSVPKSKWLTQESKFSSAEYHTNNLLNSVLFEESSTFIPKNALTIEIAPHALLQSILRNSISGGVHIGLTRRNAENNVLVFLNALGDLYLNGLELGIDKLYPTVEFPVSRGTPGLSHLIEFDHSHQFFVIQYKDNLSEKGIETFRIKLNDDHQYLKGNNVDGLTIIPAAFYIECVWKTFASSIGILNFEDLGVEFENVNFVRETSLSFGSIIELVVTVQRGSGNFEITHDQSLVVSGIIREMTAATNQMPLEKSERSEVTLQKDDFYKELRLRGYNYNEDFKGVVLAESSGSYAKIKWDRNWVTFIDSILQVGIIGHKTRNLVLPKRVRYLRINPQHHIKSAAQENQFELHANPLHKSLTSGGVTIVGFVTSIIQNRMVYPEPILEKYEFVPHYDSTYKDLIGISKIMLQILIENSYDSNVKVMDFTAAEKNESLTLGLIQAVKEKPNITADFVIHSDKKKSFKCNIQDVTCINSDDDGFETTCGDIVITNLKDLKDHIKHVKLNGFVLLREKTLEKFDSQSQFGNFVPVCVFVLKEETLIFFKSIKNTPNKSCILKISPNEGQFQWLDKLKKIKNAYDEVILVSENNSTCGVLGFMESIIMKSEWKKVRCVLIDDMKAPPFSEESDFYKGQLQLDLKINVFKEGSWGSYYHIKLKQKQPVTTRADNVFGSITRIGDLSSIKWVHGSPYASAAIDVVYSALNFRDALLATGRLTLDTCTVDCIEETKILGFEFSGICKKSNNPIMGMTDLSPVNSQIFKPTELTWDVPANWSLREAATIPVAYTTVYYAFFCITDIRRGKSILIHAGSGAVGLAAIRVALAYGLEVFTTVSTLEKRTFLLNLFPALKENHIGNSRDTSFEDMVIEQTNGNGVDFVLNSLSEDKLIASLRCLATRGHFLEIGKYDMDCNNSVGLAVFMNELSFHAVLTEDLMKTNTDLTKEIRDHISKDIQRGIIKPLPSTVFAANEIVQAFQYIASGRHTGKVLLQIREDECTLFALPVSVEPRTYFDPSLVYIVDEGLTNFGLEVADWIAKRGARNILLSGRQNITDSYRQLRTLLMQRYGCNVLISTYDTDTFKGCREILNTASKTGDVGGIFSLGGMFEELTGDEETPISCSTAIKAKSIQYFDELSRTLCPKLSHFVVFLNYFCGDSSECQMNFKISCSIVKRLLEDRVAHGLPGKGIEWGPVDDCTLFEEYNSENTARKLLPQTMSSCLEVFDALLICTAPLVSSIVVTEQNARFADLSAMQFVLKTIDVHDNITALMTSSLSEIGIDSLKVMEIKEGLDQMYDILLSFTDLKNLPLGRLMNIFETKAESTVEKKLFDLNYSDVLQMFYGNFEINVADSVNIMRANEVSTGVPVIILSGIGGSLNEDWRNLCKNLKAPTYALQFLHKNLMGSIDDMVNFAYTEISSFLHKLNLKEFHLVAYSFGAMVAHPTVELLEKSGYYGKVAFIEGSPLLIESLFELLRPIFAPDELEKKAIISVLNIVCPNLDIKTAERNLRHRYHWEDYLQYVREVMRERHFKNDVIQYVMCYLENLVKKIRMLQEPQSYKVFGIMQTDVMVLKATKKMVVNCDECCGLLPYSKNVIRTSMLDGDHQSILRNSELPIIINNFFSST